MDYFDRPVEHHPLWEIENVLVSKDGWRTQKGWEVFTKWMVWHHQKYRYNVHRTRDICILLDKIFKSHLSKISS